MYHGLRLLTVYFSSGSKVIMTYRFWEGFTNLSSNLKDRKILIMRAAYGKSGWIYLINIPSNHHL